MFVVVFVSFLWASLFSTGFLIAQMHRDSKNAHKTS